jgi:hypothetical protein
VRWLEEQGLARDPGEDVSPDTLVTLNALLTSRGTSAGAARR